MAYVQLENLERGMDRKRVNRVNAKLGSAWTIKNGHLSRGGDVVRRKEFVEVGIFPNTTRGLFSVDNTLYTVGYDSGEASNVPSSVNHILTQHPTPSTALTKVLDGKAFDGTLYSICRFSDGNIYHYYGTERVTDWDTLSADVGSNNAVAAALAAAIDKSVVVSATDSSNVVTITGAENDVPFTVTAVATDNGSNPDQTITVVETQTASGAQPQISTVTIGGTFEASDSFTVTLNSTETYRVTGGSSGMGTRLKTFKSKLYSTASSSLYFCALNAPTQWISGTDYGFINMSSQSGGQDTLVAIEEYEGLLAIFSEDNILIWSISEDSSANVFLQTLQNTGTIAPGSVVQYGNNDVFYLHSSGIRSIKARDSSNAAYVSDVGTSIDVHIRDYIDTLTDTQVADAVGVIEPVDGRYWLAIGQRIYVFSYFPSAKISAWSYYELDFQITHIAKVRDRVYVRGTKDGVDKLYLYGGTNNDTYASKGENPVVIELPFLGSTDPATFKQLIGFDIIGINDWKVDILPDPSDLSVQVTQGIASGTTYGQPRFGFDGIASLVGINLTCTAAGLATFSALALHYTDSFEGG